jgi:hypothetical protein
MPTGGAVRQAVLNHAPHGGGNDAVGVMPVGHRQIQHVGIEVMIAALAIVLGIRHVQVARPPMNRVAQLMQFAMASPQARSSAVA